MPVLYGSVEWHDSENPWGEGKKDVEIRMPLQKSGACHSG